MTEGRKRIVLLADFEIRNLAGALRALRGEGVEVATGGFGQIAQLVLDPGDALWASPTDLAVVWTLPQAVAPSFHAACEGQPWSPAALDREVEDHVALVARLVGRVDGVLLPTWTCDPRFRNRGLATTRGGVGVHHALVRMNLRLMEEAEKRPGLFVIPAEPWLATVAPAAFSPKHWYLSKWPFALGVAKAAAADILGAAEALTGASKKLIVLDLDDTLWGGVLGEEGIEGLVLGGHDATGEAFLDFQRALEALRRGGVLLAVASKNDEMLALEAIARHPEMILRQQSFATWRINWEDKAENIVAIADELSLGLDSIVFIDDNAAERDRVRSALPAVTVPEWPADRMLYAQTLRSLACFDTPVISEEDRGRAAQYVAERGRRTVRDQLGSVEEWVRSLEVRVELAALDKASVPRAAQLLNKTNQMNLATRRMSATELELWAEAPAHRMLTVRAADRLGDYGLVGLLGLRMERESLEVVDFVLSCRAMGRGVEEAMVRAALDMARQSQKAGLVARYRRTERNAACLKKFQELCRHGDSGDTSTFFWDAKLHLPEFGGIRYSLTGVAPVPRR